MDWLNRFGKNEHYPVALRVIVCGVVLLVVGLFFLSVVVAVIALLLLGALQLGAWVWMVLAAVLVIGLIGVGFVGRVRGR